MGLVPMVPTLGAGLVLVVEVLSCNTVGTLVGNLMAAGKADVRRNPGRAMQLEVGPEGHTAEPPHGEGASCHPKHEPQSQQGHRPTSRQARRQ